MLFALPLTKEMGGLAKVTVGVMIPPTAQDVGGNIDPMNAYPVIHGGQTGDNRALLDGMQFNGEGAGPRLLLQSGGRAGSQRAARRPDRGVRERRLPGEHDPEGRRQPVLPACSAPTTPTTTWSADNLTAGAAGPRASPGQHDQAHLRRQRRGRWPDLPGHACGSSRSHRVFGYQNYLAGNCVEPDAEHAVLHAGPEPPGDPSAGQRLRRRSLHLSAVEEGQDFRGVGHSSTRTSAWAAVRSSRRRPPTSPSTPTRTTCSSSSGAAS